MTPFDHPPIYEHFGFEDEFLTDYFCSGLRYEGLLELLLAPLRKLQPHVNWIGRDTIIEYFDHE